MIQPDTRIRRGPHGDIPSGQSPTGPSTIPETNNPEGARNHAEQFLRMTTHLTPEDRLQLIFQTSGGSMRGAEDDDEESEKDRSIMNTLTDRTKALHINLEPQYYESTGIYTHILQEHDDESNDSTQREDGVRRRQ